MIKEKVMELLRKAHVKDIINRYFYSSYFNDVVDDDVFDDVIREISLKEGADGDEQIEELKVEFGKIVDEFYQKNSL